MTHPNRSLLRALGWLLLALILGAIGALAQERPEPLPDIPEAHQATFTRLDWSLLAADGAIRGLDVYSTRKMLQNGGTEIFLPKIIARHPAAMAALEAADVTLAGLSTRWLIRHGHRRTARLLLLTDTGLDAPWAIHNLFVKKNSPGMSGLLRLNAR